MSGRARAVAPVTALPSMPTSKNAQTSAGRDDRRCAFSLTRAAALTVLLSMVFFWCPLVAAEYSGWVKYSGAPVPGATVTAVRNGARLIAITDSVGRFVFPAISDRGWDI